MNDVDLIAELAQFENDPLGFVLWAFPWGEPGPLEFEQLETWQFEFLQQLGEDLRAGRTPARYARTSGHGSGKSAMTGMLTWWAASTMSDSKGVITANTETQLKTKTWPEIAKWFRMFIAREFFEMTATAIFPRDLELQRTWRFDMVPWSERNTEAFAGLHNKDRRVFILMDEASAIPDVIHEVTEGALTDANTQIIWIMFGNPTRNKGRLRETAPDGKFGRRWNFAAIDTRLVRRSNKAQIAEWAEDYGEDSDFFRIRVSGQFPRQDSDSFIGLQLVKDAILRALPLFNYDETVLGVDVARFGEDSSVIYPRKGLDARSFPPQFYMKMDLVALSFCVRDAVLFYNPTMVFIDETGLGAGLVDMLNRMRLNTIIIGVNFSAKPNNYEIEKYANKRAEMWGSMRDFLRNHGCIPEHLPKMSHSFIEELTAPGYAYNAKDAILLESKKDMRRLGKKSPDAADALALTFAIPVMLQLAGNMGHNYRAVSNNALTADYNPREEFRRNVR
jgi:hypothetical protein